MADLICDEVLTVEQETSEHLQTENEMSNMGKSIKVQIFWEGFKYDEIFKLTWIKPSTRRWNKVGDFVKNISALS